MNTNESKIKTDIDSAVNKWTSQYRSGNSTEKRITAASALMILALTSKTKDDSKIKVLLNLLDEIGKN